MPQHAYSTSDPAILAAYHQTTADHAAMGERIRDDLTALGAGPQVWLQRGSFGSANQITAIQQNGDHVPDGWRIVRGNLEPRRGKPGEAARKWLADHQLPDLRHVLAQHGLPRNVWVPNPSQGNYRVCPPELFELDGVLWALYDAEPGNSEISFDTEKCTWTPRKLSEFHAAAEAREAATATQPA